MNNDQPEDASLAQAIIEIIQNKEPQNVQQLLRLVKENTSLQEREIMEYIMRLQSQGKIILKEPPTPTSQSLSIYLRTREASWYWITMILAATTTIAVFTIPEDAYPIVYIRYFLGTIFTIWLPGYSFIRTLFPQKEIDNIERVALSIGMSLALVPIIGLILNYTPWGIRTTPVTLSLLALTTIFATVAIIREHQTKTKPTTRTRSTLKQTPI